MKNAYIRLQDAALPKYKRDYKKWTDSMTPEEREVLKDLGLSKPLSDHHGKGGAKLDVADSPAASYEPDMAAIIDGEHEDESDDSSGRNSTDAIRRFLAILFSHDNMRLTVDCFAVAFGLLPCNDDSMTAIAERHGKSPAAVSSRCVTITNELGVRPSRAMRSLLARLSSKQAQLKFNRNKEQ